MYCQASFRALVPKERGSVKRESAFALSSDEGLGKLECDPIWPKWTRFSHVCISCWIHCNKSWIEVPTSSQGCSEKGCIDISGMRDTYPYQSKKRLSTPYWLIVAELISLGRCYAKHLFEQESMKICIPCKKIHAVFRYCTLGIRI